MNGYAYIKIMCDPDVKQSVLIATRAAVRQTECYEHIWKDEPMGNEQEFTLYVTGTNKQLNEARKSIRRLSRGKPRFVTKMITSYFNRDGRLTESE